MAGCLFTQPAKSSASAAPDTLIFAEFIVEHLKSSQTAAIAASVAYLVQPVTGFVLSKIYNFLEMPRQMG